MKQQDIAELLPAIYRSTLADDSAEGGVLDAMLSVMEKFHKNPESILLNLQDYFHPYHCPDSFVYMLANWLNLGDLIYLNDTPLGQQPTAHFESGIPKLRDLVASSAELSRWRGTHDGMIQFLEVATGFQGYKVSDQHVNRAFHIVVDAPKASKLYKKLIQAIIKKVKPAHVTHELTFDL